MNVTFLDHSEKFSIKNFGLKTIGFELTQTDGHGSIGSIFFFDINALKTIKMHKNNYCVQISRLLFYQTPLNLRVNLHLQFRVKTH